ncbi:MAG: hypothetical protein KAJ10_15510, partial [Thermodesulfovibrionia bacterium]|nr:hypothetical protein [Thermodesulfovibrionia bacterium]
MKKASFYCAFISMLIISAISFGQTYSGPATGSVGSGVVVTTDNFVLVPIGSELPSEQKIINIEEPDFGPMYYNGDMEVFDDYVYIDDSNAQQHSGGEIGINFKLHSFPSIPMTNSIPPDPHMAVGPNHVITTVNSRFHIYDREGNLLKNIDANAWTSAVLPNPGAFDPQIIYDHYEGRWFMLWYNQNSTANTAFFLISYSDDSNPLGTWYMYALDATKNGSNSTTTWGDYPQIGYDDQAIYINSRQFGFSGGLFYNKIRILTKSELYAANAGPLTWVDIWNIRRPNGSEALDVLQPALSYDPGINAAYFTWSSSGTANFYTLYKITNPITNPVLTGVELPVPTYFQAPLANQLGGGSPRIETGGSKIRAATVLRDGKLYAVHGMRNSQFAAYGSLKYFVVDVNTNTILEQVEQGAQGFFFFYPAIIVDQDHNIAITYSRSADTEYAGSYYSTKLGTDPPGLSPSKVMVEGLGNYVVTFGGSRNRWGDYLGAALDPVNQYDIWLYSEYAAGTNQWGTWLTEIRMQPFQGVYAHTLTPDLDFGNIEVNFTSNTITAILANYGDQDLVI